MTESKKLLQFKDFFLEDLSISNFKGESFNIAGMRGEIYLFEDIFAGPISGSIQIFDAMDLPHLLPFIGEERITIKFFKPGPSENENDSTDGTVYERTFRVYNITDRMPIKENFQSYTIHFVSEEFFRNFFQVVQRGFISKRYSEMIQEVFEEMVQIERPIEIEATKYEHNFVAGNLTPFQFFNCLAANSVSDEENGSAYVFFEDQEKFNFVSVGKLMKSEPVHTILYQPTNLPENQTPTGANYDTPNEIINVEVFQHNANINPVENIAFGMYGSSLFHIDPIRARFEKQEFKLSEQFENFVHIDNEPPFREELDLLDKTDANIKFLVSYKDHDLQEHLTERDSNIRSDKFEECVLQRNSQMLQMETVRITVKIPGDPKLTVGQVIEFGLPQQAGDVAKDRPKELDDYLQGNYLITSLKHSIIDEKYTITMEIIKDTYHTPIKFIDPVDKYQDRY